jgi:hypothetical protein
MIINRDTLPTEDIIPVTFVGGTGGNFLCHFIVSAKRNIKDIIKLSEHGNAHSFCFKDIPCPVQGLLTPDLHKIKYIFSQSPYSCSIKPHYTSAHLTDINTINSYFSRSIRITYEVDDIPDIATVFYGKFIVDEGKTKRSIEYISAECYQRINKFSFKENMTNVLFVSWKELFKGNIEEFISKLSIFTGIDKDNFSQDTLIHWRNKTQYCIDKFKDIR